MQRAHNAYYVKARVSTTSEIGLNAIKRKSKFNNFIISERARLLTNSSTPRRVKIGRKPYVMLYYFSVNQNTHFQYFF